MKKTTLVILIFIFNFICTHSQGQVGWQWGAGSMIYGSAATEVDRVTTDPLGNSYVSGVIIGSTDSSSFGSFTVYKSIYDLQMVVAKTDSAGHYLWAIGTDCYYAAPSALVADSSGNLYVAGTYTGASLGFGPLTLSNPTDREMEFLVKISPGGVPLWAINLAQDTSINDYGCAAGLGIDGSKHIYVTACFNSPTANVAGVPVINSCLVPGGAQSYIAKFDSLGNTIWVKKYGGHSLSFPMTMAVAPGGDMLISGRYYTDSFTAGATVLTSYPNTFVAKFDSSGTAAWAKDVHRDIKINAVTIDDSENVYFTGELDSNIILGTDTLTLTGTLSDFFIGRYNSNGSYGWAHSATGGSNEVGWGIAADHCGHIWACGSLPGGPGAGIIFDAANWAYAPPSSPDPMFAVDYSHSGSVITALGVASGGDDAMGIAVDCRGNFVIGGDYKALYPANPFIFGEDTLYPPASEWLFMARYKYDTSLCAPAIPSLATVAITPLAAQITLYPNPAQNELAITATDKITRITITNLMGQTVYTHAYNSDRVLVDIAALRPGIYFVRINGTQVRKFVKD